MFLYSEEELERLHELRLAMRTVEQESKSLEKVKHLGSFKERHQLLTELQMIKDEYTSLIQSMDKKRYAYGLQNSVFRDWSEKAKFVLRKPESG